MKAMTIEEFDAAYAQGISPLEARMALLLRAMYQEEHHLPECVREHEFHPDRKWRFDFAFPAVNVAIEVQGGTWSNGRHTRGGGYAADCEKMNEAQRMGWTVLQFTSDMIDDVQATEDTILAALGAAGWKWRTDE